MHGRENYPPAIGTVQRCWRGEDETYGFEEVPIIETFMLRGQLFGVVLDLDGATDDNWHGSVPGLVSAVHVSTGLTCPLWVPLLTIKQAVSAHWNYMGVQSPCYTAARMGLPFLNGEVNAL